MRCLFIFTVAYVHQACGHNYTTVLSKLSLFTLIDPFLYFYWPVLAAVSLTPVQVFHCFETPDAAVHRNLFSVMTLKKKLCAFNVWLSAKGKFQSISNIKSQPKVALERLCVRVLLFHGKWSVTEHLAEDNFSGPNILSSS